MAIQNSKLNVYFQGLYCSCYLKRKNEWDSFQFILLFNWPEESILSNIIYSLPATTGVNADFISDLTYSYQWAHVCMSCPLDFSRIIHVCVSMSIGCKINSSEARDDKSGNLIHHPHNSWVSFFPKLSPVFPLSCILAQNHPHSYGTSKANY